MNNLKNIPLLGESHKNSEWIPDVSKKWIPPVKTPKKWGTHLGEPRKQWQNNRNGGKK